MYTQCPKCKVVFTIAADQLEHRDGVVRCGTCMTIFDASLSLSEDMPVAKPAESEAIDREDDVPLLETVPEHVEEPHSNDVDPDQIIREVEQELAVIEPVIEIGESDSLPVDDPDDEDSEFMKETRETLLSNLDLEQQDAADAHAGAVTVDEEEVDDDEQGAPAAPYSVASYAMQASPRVSDEADTSGTDDTVLDGFEVDELDEDEVRAALAEHSDRFAPPIIHAVEPIEAASTLGLEDEPARGDDAQTPDAAGLEFHGVDYQSADIGAAGTPAADGAESGVAVETNLVDSVAAEVDNARDLELNLTPDLVPDLEEDRSTGIEAATLAVDDQADAIEWLQDESDDTAKADNDDESGHAVAEAAYAELELSPIPADVTSPEFDDTPSATGSPNDAVGVGQLEVVEPAAVSAQIDDEIDITEPPAFDFSPRTEDAGASVAPMLGATQPEPVEPEPLEVDEDDGLDSDDLVFPDDEDFFPSTDDPLEINHEDSTDLASEIEFVARLERHGQSNDLEAHLAKLQSLEAELAQSGKHSTTAADVDDDMEVIEVESSTTLTDFKIAASAATIATMNDDASLAGSGWWQKAKSSLYAVTCIGLIVALGWQVRSFYLDDLAQYPAMRPLLTAVCEWTKCELPSRIAPDQMSLLATFIDVHPDEPDAIRIATQITNSATFAQPYPNVRLTMTDKHGRVLARRKVTPQDYLPPMPEKPETDAVMIAAGQTEKVYFDLLDPRDDAFGYEVELVRAE